MDPFHYVHNGVGLEAVSVICCDAGIDLYSMRPTDSARANRILRLRRDPSPRRKARAQRLFRQHYPELAAWLTGVSDE
jgi:hypothetical protein